MLTGKLAARATAFVVHEDEIVGNLAGCPGADLAPRRARRVWLVDCNVEQVHRPAEVERHLLIERREVPCVPARRVCDSAVNVEPIIIATMASRDRLHVRDRTERRSTARQLTVTAHQGCEQRTAELLWLCDA